MHCTPVKRNKESTGTGILVLTVLHIDHFCIKILFPRAARATTKGKQNKNKKQNKTNNKQNPALKGFDPATLYY